MIKNLSTLTILLCGAALLGACGAPDLHHDPRLDGKWLSSVEKTLPGIEASPIMSAEEKGQAAHKLGQLAFIFRGNTTAVTFEKKPEERIAQQIYTVTARTDNSISIQTSKGSVATYYLEGDCFYLVNPDWNYRDYFCKVAEKAKE